MTAQRAAALLVALTGCGDATSLPDGGDSGICHAPDGGAPATVTVVSHQRIDGVAGSPTYRSVTTSATLPAGCYAAVHLRARIATNCAGASPPGTSWPAGCDPVPRLAQVSLADPDRQAPLLLLDGVTSYGGDVIWEQDVTDYATILFGTHRYRVSVEAEADPAGKLAGTAAAHDVDVRLLVTPGTPPRAVIAALPLADATLTPDHATLTASYTAPPGARRGRIDLFASGHGAIGDPPCDDECPRTTRVTVDGIELYADTPWRECADVCTHLMLGGTLTCDGASFDYFCRENPAACPPVVTAARSHWCPSRTIAPIAIDLPDAALTGAHIIAIAVTQPSGRWPVGLSAVLWR